MTAPHLLAALQNLAPGQAIHIGHSFLVINLGGVRIALDPATEDGRCAAPFSNLTLTGANFLRSYRPLVDPGQQVPAAEDLARCVDWVLYSHLHTDHFNVALLGRMLRANPALRVVWPAGTPRLLTHPRRTLSRAAQRVLAELNGLPWADNIPAALREFLESETPALPLERTQEITPEAELTLHAEPRLSLRAFAVRHPRPLLWVRSPWEPAAPPVLGYEVTMATAGAADTVLLVGETSTDPEVLYRIWAARDRLLSVFLPADEMPRLPALREWYDACVHASPRLLALAERLTGDQTSLHGLHHGLWLYTLRAADLTQARAALRSERSAPPARAAEVGAALLAGRRAPRSAWPAVQSLAELVQTLQRYRPEAEPRVSLPPLGRTFRLGA